jgi:hypothetical protein
MMNFNCQSLKHTGLWSPVTLAMLPAFEGNYSTAPTSIRSSDDQGRIQQGFIEGESYT